MTDVRWMRLALALARRGLGRTAPNPAVGCVIVKDGRVVGRGWTQPGGRPHAEAVALAAAGPAARGAVAYVTLEPCAHHGRTPPCAEALVTAGVARVVCPIGDPDPRVSGRGFARLRAAGLTVDIGLMAEEAAALNAGFLSRLTAGRPRLVLKLAATLDGRIATASGESQWITGPEARAAAHMLRAEADAILVGAGTVLADDPRLDCRLPGLEGASPRPVALDGAARTPPDAKIVARGALILHRAEADPARLAALRTAGADVAEVPTDAAGLTDAAAALELLAGRGATRVLCEGGGRLAASLLAADLVDELVWASAGMAIGAEGLPAVGGLALERLDAAPRFRLASVAPCGADVLMRWVRA